MTEAACSPVLKSLPTIIEESPALVSLKPLALVESVVPTGGFSAVFTEPALETLPESVPPRNPEVPSTEADPAWPRPSDSAIAEKEAVAEAAPVPEVKFVKTLEKPTLGMKGIAAAMPLSDSLVLAIPAAVLFGLPQS